MPSRRYIFIALVFVANILVAQTRLSKPEVFLGVHGGVKASTILFNPSVKTLDIMQSPLSGNGGLVFRYAEHRVCALQIECNYVQNGWSELYTTSTSTPVLYTRRLHYIQVPFLMHLGFGKKRFHPFLNFGPQIGYCFKDQYTLSAQSGVSLDGLQHKTIDNPFDWGAAAGLGCYYHSRKAGVFQLEARFAFSLGGAFDVGQLEYFKMANSMGLSVNLAYLWEFKNK